MSEQTKLKYSVNVWILIENIPILPEAFLTFASILCVLYPAGQNVRQDLSSLPDISKSLPDMSSIFRHY